jgi:hypothetical protein
MLNELMFCFRLVGLSERWMFCSTQELVVGEFSAPERACWLAGWLAWPIG